MFDTGLKVHRALRVRFGRSRKYRVVGNTEYGTAVRHGVVYPVLKRIKGVGIVAVLAR